MRSPCTREKLTDVLNNISVQTAGCILSPGAWTKDDHTRPASFTAYAWDPKTSSVETHHRLGTRFGRQARRPSSFWTDLKSSRDCVTISSSARSPDPGKLLCRLYQHGICADLSGDTRSQPGAQNVMVFGAFLFFQALVTTGGNLPVAVLFVGIVGSAVVGALIYFGVMRPLAGCPVAVGVLATIAVGIVLRSLTTFIWTGQTRLSGRVPRPTRKAHSTRRRFVDRCWHRRCHHHHPCPSR